MGGFTFHKGNCQQCSPGLEGEPPWSVVGRPPGGHRKIHRTCGIVGQRKEVIRGPALGLFGGIWRVRVFNLGDFIVISLSKRHHWKINKLGRWVMSHVLG